MSDLSSRPILAEVPVRKSKSKNSQRTAVQPGDGAGQQRQHRAVMDESSGSGTSRSVLTRSPNDPDAGLDDERELKYGASHVIKLVSRFADASEVQTDV